MTNYDFVVVGAGTGGCIAAKTAAKLGLKVCLIDRKPKREIGDKICGEAIGEGHFDEVGINIPSGSELSRVVDGADIYSPDLKTVFRIESSDLTGFVINRYEFGQRLLKEALDAGVDLFDHTLVVKTIINKDYMKGVEAKDLKAETSSKINGKIIVDASGFASILRRQLPESWRIENSIRNDDIGLGYMEIRELKEQFENPNYIKLYLSNKIAAGGYYWIFPKDGTKVNVGIGVIMAENFSVPKDQLYKYVLTADEFNDSKIIRKGTWPLPTRRPISSMVANGIIIIGDAACQTNPVHGGGIGPSMIGGKLAAEFGSKAIESNDLSRNALWPFNMELAKLCGAKSAALDVFRIFLQKCDDEELSYGMENRLITEEDVLKASMGGELHLNITEKATRVFRGLRKPRFLKQLNLTANKMKEIKELYYNYPKPEELEQWDSRVQHILNEMRALN